MKGLDSDRSPSGWQVVRLGDVANVAFSTVDKKSVDDEDPIALCNYTDVFYNRRIRPGMDFMAATATPVERQRWALKKGDVLFTKDSETPEEIGIPSYVSEDMSDVLCGYHLGMARPQAGLIHGAYLSEILGSSMSRRQFARIANGVTRFGLTLGATRSLSILLPPLPEQRAIAAILESVDEAIERTEAVIAATEHLRDALLHELLTRGVPGWHTEWGYLPGIGTIPADWEVVNLGDESERITKGTTPTTLGRQYTSSGVRFLRVENIADDGTIRGGEPRFIDQDTHNALSRSILRQNDLVLSIAGALGRSALITEDVLPSNLNQALAIIRLSAASRVLPAFLSYALRGRTIQKQIEDMRVELAQANISLEMVKTLRIALPPLAEQRAIATNMENVENTIDGRRIERDALESLKTAAADALLTGRLRTRDQGVMFGRP